MPNSTLELFEDDLLLVVLQITRRRYEAGECGVDDYLKALKNFSNHILRGI